MIHLSRTPDNSLSEPYIWAKGKIDKPVMFEYILHKVNGQQPEGLFLLLKQASSLRPNAEIQISHSPDREKPFQASFNLLPFNTKIPRPDLLKVSFYNPSELIQWLKSGQTRIQFTAISGEGR